MLSREQQFAECFEKYHSDKGIHNYAPIYAYLPCDLKSILEIGVYWGGSLITSWCMFPQANPIVGFDINLSLLTDPMSCFKETGMDTSQRIALIDGDLRSHDFSSLPDFDLIIDDGTHETGHILSLWDRLHKKAKRFYIIEDVYLSRMMEIWTRIALDVPQAQILFWRTSDHCGDDRIRPDSDSQCIVVKF
jgi:hypothetical protein